MLGNKWKILTFVEILPSEERETGDEGSTRNLPETDANAPLAQQLCATQQWTRENPIHGAPNPNPRVRRSLGSGEV
jgi:hypothetical protein